MVCQLRLFILSGEVIRRSPPRARFYVNTAVSIHHPVTFCVRQV
jgi:hypothetical protein